MAEVKQRELFRRFQVQKFLGKGSYGSVYRIKRLDDEAIYAVKETDVTKMSQVERQDAANEIRLLASIKHPNVVRYYEAFLDGNWLCIVMEFAACGDLSDYIKKGRARQTPFPEDVVWAFLIQIMSGINSLHQKRILHRDIKPMNIFIGKGDVVKVGDLGIAKILNKSNAANTQIGTPHFMAPEVWKGKPYSYSADMWSIGCLLYEMMTYRVPFEAKTLKELRAKVEVGKVSAPVGKNYSEELRSLCSRMLTVDVADRPTVAQVLQMSCITKRMSLVPSGCGKDYSAPTIGTIKVPANLRQLHDKLPGADYSRTSTGETTDPIAADWPAA